MTDFTEVEHLIVPGPSVPLARHDHEDKAVAGAIRVAKQILPRLTEIARTASELDAITVSLCYNGNPQTNGKFIEIPVTVDWAELDPVEPCSCDDMSCAYCLAVALILHEAAHIKYGSNAEVERAQVIEFKKSIDDALAAVGDDKFTDKFMLSHQDFLKHDVTYLEGSHIMELCARINRHSPQVLNALEDIRINKLMGADRTALPPPLRSYTTHMYTESMKGRGYFDAPPSMQITIAIAYLGEYGERLDFALSSEVLSDAMSDKFIQYASKKPYRSVFEAAGWAVVICEYGSDRFGAFYDPRHHYDSDVSDSSKGRSLKQGKDRGEDGKLKPGQRKRDEKVIDTATEMTYKRKKRDLSRSKPTLHQEDLQPSEKGDSDKAITEAMVREAMRTAFKSSGDSSEGEEVNEFTVAQTSGGDGSITSGEGAYPVAIFKPTFTHEDFEGNPADPGGDSPLFAVYPGVRWAVGATEDQLLRDSRFQSIRPRAGTVIQLREALGKNRRSANVPNLLDGRIHGSKLARVSTGGRRVFRRVEKPANRSYAVLIGIDLSGSTTQWLDGEGSIQDALLELAYTQACMLHSVGVPFMVVGHTGSRRNRNRSQSGLTLLDPDDRAEWPDGMTTDLYIAKTFKEPWNELSRLSLSSLQSCNANLDGQTMRAYMRMLASQRATDRILMYYTDGQMPAEDGIRQGRILNRELAKAKAWSRRKHDRLTVVGVGYGNKDPENYGLDTIYVDPRNPIADQVHTVVDGLAQRIIDPQKGRK